MKDILPYLQSASIATVTAFFFWFLWWKRQLHQELVEPDIKLINKDIERMNARIIKLENRTDIISSSFDDKISEIKEELTEIKEMVANLNGKLEIFLEQRNK